MDLKVLAPVFTAVLIAELGDKTQLATVLFAADRETDKLSVFLGASMALVVTSAIGVFAGCFIARYVSEEQLRYAAGIGFIIIGLWTLLRH